MLPKAGFGEHLGSPSMAPLPRVRLTHLGVKGMLYGKRTSQDSNKRSFYLPTGARTYLAQDMFAHVGRLHGTSVPDRVR